MEGFMEVKENWERRYKEEKRKVPGEILFRSFCQMKILVFYSTLLAVAWWFNDWYTKYKQQIKKFKILRSKINLRDFINHSTRIK